MDKILSVAFVKANGIDMIEVSTEKTIVEKTLYEREYLETQKRNLIIDAQNYAATWQAKMDELNELLAQFTKGKEENSGG